MRKIKKGEGTTICLKIVTSDFLKTLGNMGNIHQEVVEKLIYKAGLAERYEKFKIDWEKDNAETSNR